MLHADGALIAVDKPQGLLSVPGRGPGRADCLIARLALADPGLRPVHRLDRDTSGVMVLARSAPAQAALGRQFEERRVAKTYHALVTGWPGPDAGRIALPLAADWPNRPRQMVSPTGRDACTDWRVLARRTDGTALLELSPLTGRSHQLRVHLAALGHPILGDPLYGGAAARRMMLHATRLRLHHPETGLRLDLHAPCPFGPLSV